MLGSKFTHWVRCKVLQFGHGNQYPFGVLGMYIYQFGPTVKGKNLCLVQKLNPTPSVS